MQTVFDNCSLSLSSSSSFHWQNRYHSMFPLKASQCLGLIKLEQKKTFHSLHAQQHFEPLFICMLNSKCNYVHYAITIFIGERATHLFWFDIGWWICCCCCRCHQPPSPLSSLLIIWLLIEKGAHKHIKWLPLHSMYEDMYSYPFLRILNAYMNEPKE